MVKRILLLFLEDLPIFITKKIYKLIKFKSDKVTLAIFQAVQFVSWIALYSFIAYKFNLFSNFFIFLFLFVEIRRRFQEVEEKTNTNKFKVLHSTVIGCFFLTFGYILNFLIFAFFYKNIILQIIFSVILAINTIDFENCKMEDIENGLMGRKNPEFELESRIIKYFITEKEDENFKKVLKNICEINSIFKTILDGYYGKNKTLLALSFDLNLSYDTTIRCKKKFLKTLKENL